VSIAARILPLAAAIVTALAVASASTAKDTFSIVFVNLSFGTKPTLTVQTHTAGGFSFSFLGGDETATAASGVSIDFAPGYTPPVPAPGASAGTASFESASGSQSGNGVLLLGGNLSVEDPATYANDPAALACAPGPYLAVWKLTASAAGLGLTLPFFVEHPSGDATRIEIRFCPPPLSDAQGRPGPSAPGRYVSSAYVTPANASAIEARAVEPRPHSLTLKARYDAKTRSALVTGRVVEAGKPQAHAAVELYSPSNPAPKTIRTSTGGTFATRVRLSGTTVLVARVDEVTGPCGGTSTAPAGCASLTVTGTNTASVTPIVRR
jgi:hypothetical protein